VYAETPAGPGETNSRPAFRFWRCEYAPTLLIVRTIPAIRTLIPSSIFEGPSTIGEGFHLLAFFPSAKTDPRNPFLRA
jgi:hypothetical protein